MTNREYLDIKQKELLDKDKACSNPKSRLQVPFRPLAEEFKGRSRCPWIQQSGVRRSRDLHPTLSRSMSRHSRKTVTFNEKVEMYTPLNNVVWIPLEDSKYTLGMVAFHQNSPMRHTGTLYSMEVRGDLWAHDNSLPVKSFFE